MNTAIIYSYLIESPYGLCFDSGLYLRIVFQSLAVFPIEEMMLAHSLAPWFVVFVGASVSRGERESASRILPSSSHADFVRSLSRKFCGV